MFFLIKKKLNLVNERVMLIVFLSECYLIQKITLVKQVSVL
jgi:hypothetical protein